METGDFRRGQEGRSTQQDTPPPTAPRDHTKSTKNRQVQKNFDVDEHRNILGTLDTSVNNHQNKQKADQKSSNRTIDRPPKKRTTRQERQEMTTAETPQKKRAKQAEQEQRTNATERNDADKQNRHGGRPTSNHTATTKQPKKRQKKKSQSPIRGDN